MSHGSLSVSGSPATLRSRLAKSLAVAVFTAAGLAGITGLTGCNHSDGSALVPQGSRLIGAGEGGNQTPYEIHDAGTAYVTEPNHNRIVWKGTVQPGDKVKVDGDSHAILLNDQIVSQNDIAKRRDYQVWLHP